MSADTKLRMLAECGEQTEKKAKELMNENTFFSLVGDNLDMRIQPRVVCGDNQVFVDLL